MSDPILYEVDGAVATISINRPHAYNSLDYEAYAQLSRFFGVADEDPAVRVVIFTGRERGFCTGDDVRELLGEGAKALSEHLANGTLELPSDVMRRSKTPIIAAVNGAAVGYGMGLSLLADVRIASTEARFSEMFVKRAILAGADSFNILPRLVGPAMAAELFLTGDLIDAQRALEIGLVSRVVEPDELLPSARALAARIAANPPLAVRAAKEALTMIRDDRVEEAREWIPKTLTDLLLSEDHRESVRAFVERREPKYEGR